MEYITNSSGIKYSLNECHHDMVILRPLPYTDPAPSHGYHHHYHPQPVANRNFHTRSNSFNGRCRLPRSSDFLKWKRSTQTPLFLGYRTLTKSNTNSINIRPSSVNRSMTFGSSNIVPTSPSSQLLRSCNSTLLAKISHTSLNSLVFFFKRASWEALWGEHLRA